MNPTLPSKKGYKIPDAADLIDVSRKFLETEIKRGRLPVTRLSTRCVRIRPEDLDAYLLKYRIGGEGQ